MTTGAASGDWNAGGDAGTGGNWGGDPGGDWNSGAARAVGFTSHDARFGGHDSTAADGGFSGSPADGVGAGDDGACRNCGQGEKTPATIRQDLLLT